MICRNKSDAFIILLSFLVFWAIGYGLIWVTSPVVAAGVFAALLITVID